MTSPEGTSLNTVTVMHRLPFCVAVITAVAVVRPSATTSTVSSTGGPTRTARANTAYTERTDFSGKRLAAASHAEHTQFEIDTALALVGSSGVVDDGSGPSRFGTRFLSRQTASLGGGTNEIARNIIGERVLGFPREYAADRGVPFNQVKRKRD
jgi:hypothetical protein